jgi:hypothetical protein
MKDIVFTETQVQQIINTMLQMAAKDCYDTLKMIDNAIVEQKSAGQPKPTDNNTHESN